MRPLAITDAKTIVLGLQDEIRRNDESRYDHRLHGVLLVAQGMSCPEAGRFLGDGAQTVRDWVRRFEKKGLAGLADHERSGRPPRLEDHRLEQIQSVLREPPTAVGMTGNLWDGKTLSAFIRAQYRIDLGVRQCQRIFRMSGFRLRKPRPMIAHADPELQQAYKKTPQAGRRRGRRSLGNR